MPHRSRTSVEPVEILSSETWRARADAHAERVDVWVQPHLERRRQGGKHPVHDFLFTYYSQSPTALRRWHPGGYGVAGRARVRRPQGLLGGPAVRRPSPPNDSSATAGDLRDPPAARRDRGRAPTLGCFGLHEWAMDPPDRPTAGRRGGQRDPARLAAAPRGGWHRRGRGEPPNRLLALRRVPLLHASPRPEHLPARPRGPARLRAAGLLPRRDGSLQARLPTDAAGRLGAGRGRFALAWDIRDLDMRASPYDFSDLGFEPVRIENTGGQAGVRRRAARPSPSAALPCVGG